ncbi:MAG: tetratricopeptide repeat protein [Candidatus Latescibacterota bacterium]
MADRLPALERAFRRHPDAPLFARLADAYLSRGMVFRALEVCEGGCERFPGYTTGFQVLSRCYEARGDLEKARRAMGRALRLDPQNPAGFRRLSRLHRDLGNPQLALKSLQQALRLDPLDAGLTEEVSELAHRLWAESQHRAEDTFDLLPSEVGEAPAAEAPDPGTDPRDPEAPAPAGALAAAKETAGGGEERGGLGGEAPDGELTRLFAEIEAQQARAQALPRAAEPAVPVDPEAAFAGPEAETGGAIPRIATVTLARIYSLQGLNQRAIEVCRQVLERDPGNQRARDEMVALEGKGRANE